MSRGLERSVRSRPPWPAGAGSPPSVRALILAMVTVLLLPGTAGAVDLEHVRAALLMDPATCDYTAMATYRVRFADGDPPLLLLGAAGSDRGIEIAPRADVIEHSVRWAGTAHGEGLQARDGVCFTGFATDAWLPLPFTSRGPDLIDDAFTFELLLTVPAGMKAVGPGEARPLREVAGGLETHGFDLAPATPAYLLGFAVGPFTERTETVTRGRRPRRSQVTLRYLFAPGADIAFEDRFGSTGPALTWLEAWTGVRYPDSTYTQVVVPGGVAQEKASFALLGTRTVAVADEAPSEAWFVIHELSHQWFGRHLGPRDWSDHWLTEGFAVASTWLFSEQRWGAPRGAAELERARIRFGRAASSGKDRPLRVPAWRSPGDAGGSIAYTKSLLVLARLRGAVGADAFDGGVRRWFAAASRPLAASSESLLEAMAAESTQVDLSEFLGSWVDGTGDAEELLAGP